MISSFFFFNDTATTEIYTLSLHDALPISGHGVLEYDLSLGHWLSSHPDSRIRRSEEHTSELQSQSNLVCRLLLEKKNKATYVTLPTRDRIRKSPLIDPKAVQTTSTYSDVR